MTRHPRGQVSLSLVLCLAGMLVIVLAWWTIRQTTQVAPDGRKEIVFWGNAGLGDDIYTVVHQFELENPQYKVVLSSAAARDITGDGQRLLCAINGGVPPDVVFFDRFATGEWAARGALLNLSPYLAAQKKNDPYRIDLSDDYDWAVREASYSPPLSGKPPQVYGIPLTADTRLMFINKDVFRQAGLVDAQGHVTPPTNWKELREDAKRLTIFRTPGDPRSGIKRLGFAPNAGNSWLYMYAWEAGGEMMNAQRTKVTMDSPPVVRALRFMADCYDDIGGVAQADSFQQAQQGGALDPFLQGLLAMKTDTSVFMTVIADWKPDMDFMLIPSPMPQDQIDKGREPVSWAGGFSLVIPTTAREKEGAFKLIQFINSDHGRNLLEQGAREQCEAEGRLFLPDCLANRRQYEKLVNDAVFNNPHMPQTFKDGYRVVFNLLPHTLIRPVTPIGQLLWNQHIEAYDAGVRHQYADEARRTGQDEMKLALQKKQVVAQQALDAILHPPPASPINWTPYFAGYIVLLVLPFVAMWIAFRRRKREFGYRGREVWAAMLFVSPWVLGFALFVGGPILFSIVFSFARYDILSPAGYVGLANYKELFHDPVFYKSLGNTFFMVLGIPLGMAISLAIALLLNRAIMGIGFYRSMYYLPAIVPMVAASLMWIWIFNPSYGLINTALEWIYATPPVHLLEHVIAHFTGQPFEFTLPMWLQDARWAKPSMILMQLWGAGGGMIIWLAGLQSIPGELYEAASIDGATKWKRFLHVTIPMLSPYILFNIIIGLIGTMQIFAQSYIMTPDGNPAQSTLFYAYYLFKCAFQYFRMGYASALAWILFLIVLLLTLSQLWLSKKWVHYEQA